MGVENWCSTDASLMPKFGDVTELPPFCIENLSKDLGRSGTLNDQILYTAITKVKPVACVANDGSKCEADLYQCRLICSVDFFPGPPGPPDLPVSGSGSWNWASDSEQFDSARSQLLDGTLNANLQLIFKRPSTKKTGAWGLRGIHSSTNVSWESNEKKLKGGIVLPKGALHISGHMSGLNSIGVYRSPTLHDYWRLGDSADTPTERNKVEQKFTERCSESCNVPYLHGRFSAVVSIQKNVFKKGVPPMVQTLDCAHISAIYRMYYDPSPSDGTTRGRGILHGILALNCKSTPTKPGK